MAQLLYQLEGVRGRSMWVFDKKCVIFTKAGIGSFITGNVSDGEKTIFYKDVVGVQFKKSGGMIGYLQFETPSAQMNNHDSNMFSENTFTFEHNKNGVTNEQMEAVYHQICDIIESIKYGTAPAQATPAQATPAQVAPAQATPVQAAPVQAAPVQAAPVSQQGVCPNCGRQVAPDAMFCVGCGGSLK